MFKRFSASHIYQGFYFCIKMKKIIKMDYNMDFMNMVYQPSKKQDGMLNLEEQIDKARLALKNLKNIKSVDFDFAIDKRPKSLLLKMIPDLWNDILNELDFNDNWLVFYSFGDKWRSRKLDEVNQGYLRNQIDEDFRVNNGVIAEDVEAADYDFFPVSIRELQAVRFINTGKFNANTNITNTGEIRDTPAIKLIENDDGYKKMKKLKEQGVIDNDAMDVFMTGWYAKHKLKRPKAIYKKKHGSFWKYLLKLNINLERYMIFNELDDRTIKLMESNNCLIYACKQFGLSDDIIDHMKDIIQVKSISKSKLKDIAKECNISFYLEEKDGRHHKIGTMNNVVIPLLLLENHYMLNERIKVSTYYVNHCDEIENDPKISDRSIEWKQTITRKVGNSYRHDQPDFPLKLILKTIFEVKGFDPIKVGDYLTYSSTLYKYKLASDIADLNYNPRLCSRLKQPYRFSK